MSKKTTTAKTAKAAKTSKAAKAQPETAQKIETRTTPPGFIEIKNLDALNVLINVANIVAIEDDGVGTTIHSVGDVRTLTEMQYEEVVALITADAHAVAEQW